MSDDAISKIASAQESFQNSIDKAFGPLKNFNPSFNIPKMDIPFPKVGENSPI